MIDDRPITDLAAKLTENAERNRRWRRRECINLIPSEQPTSAYVDGLTVSEPAARYNEHSRAKGSPPDAPDVRYYKGTDFIMAVEDELKAECSVAVVLRLQPGRAPGHQRTDGQRHGL
jgi:glycine/serine hydroxymethyltransferase